MSIFCLLFSIESAKVRTNLLIFASLFFRIFNLVRPDVSVRASGRGRREGVRGVGSERDSLYEFKG